MNCERCRGFMIRDSFLDLRDDTGRLQFHGWRCLNCGEVIDPVVITHRIKAPTEPYRGRTRDRRTWKRLALVPFERSVAALGAPEGVRNVSS